jgi:hypothetical protein
MGGQQREHAQLGGGERCRPNDIAAELVKLRVELTGLVRKGAQVGPPPQQVLDLAQDHRRVLYGELWDLAPHRLPT